MQQAEGKLRNRLAGRICAVLIVAEVLAFVLALLSSAGPFWLWRAGAYAAVGIAAVSAVVGAGLVVSGVIGRAPALWKWGSLVLLMNVVPFAVLLILGDLAELP